MKTSKPNNLPPGYTIQRWESRTAYARNGNAHRPTVYYVYEVVSPAGRLGVTFRTRRDAASFACEHAQEAGR